MSDQLRANWRLALYLLLAVVIFGSKGLWIPGLIAVLYFFVFAMPREWR